jgi:hypothetical protein
MTVHKDVNALASMARDCQGQARGSGGDPVSEDPIEGRGVSRTSSTGNRPCTGLSPFKPSAQCQLVVLVRCAT